MDYFFADSHFGHKNILSFERGDRFLDIQEHDNKIISLLEERLQKQDTLYHLGDFACYENEACERFSYLPCKKILIKGNHDKGKWIDKYFDKVYDVPVFYTKRIVLSHIPIPVTDGTLNVHGHLHSAYLSLDNYLNVNIHMIDYALVSQKYLLKYLSRLPKDDNRFMKEWYAKYYVSTRPQNEIRNK